MTTGLGPRPNFSCSHTRRGDCGQQIWIRVPEHLVAEIIYGDLVTSPRPAAVATDALGRRGRDCSSERWRTSNGWGGCARSRLLFRWCRGVDLAQGVQGVVGVVNFAVRR